MKILKLNKNLIIYIMAISAVIVLLLFLIITNIIGYGVKENCQRAQNQNEGDCVEALISYLNNENNNFRTRNSAI